MGKNLKIGAVFQQLAKEKGIKILLEPEYGRTGQITLPGGRKCYFKNTAFDVNMAGAAQIAKDKDYATYFLKKMGYPTPVGQSFFSDQYCLEIKSNRNPNAAYRYACLLGWPVIIKPNSKSHGVGVFKVYNKQQFEQAVSFITSLDNIFLVQKVAEGNDYRILVFDDEIICSYQRLALSVTGDGRSSVEKLLSKKKKMLLALGRHINISLDDTRISSHLKSQNLFLSSVLSKGQKAEIIPNNNLSTGGDAIDTTDETRNEWKKIAVKVTKDLGLRYCGVDIISKNTLQDKPSSFVILEINAFPDISHYVSLGEKQREIALGLYRKIFEKITA